MKYFLLCGEASGDLHAAALMRALRELDPEAEFRYYGGDQMLRQGGELLCHYRHLAYMGFIPVLLHAPAILRGLARCKQAISDWRPDCVVLVDYPGFNLKVARYVKAHSLCPVYYYISPKVWAWKEHRVKAMRRDVRRVLSILPFEVDFFRRKHGMDVTYVGNPSLDEVEHWRRAHPDAARRLRAEYDIKGDVIALLPGSRRQEIHDNLRRMLQAVQLVEQAGVVIAGAPGIEPAFYRQLAPGATVLPPGGAFALLSCARAALVTSGTATLEAALLGVPQVVCYYVPCGPLVRLARRLLLRVPYVSLVNLIAGRQVVPELVASDMNPERLARHLEPLLTDSPDRLTQLSGYALVRERLGQTGAPERAARVIVDDLRQP